MPCPRCDRPLATIELRLAHRLAVLRSCSACEVSRWEYNGTATPVGEVLDVMSATRDSFMRPGRQAA